MYHNISDGFIEVVCGPMFAGKTEELIRRIKRLEYSKKEFLVFKPEIDNRYSDKDELVSHNLSKAKAILVNKSEDIINIINGHPKTIDAVVIDEAQFFDFGIVKVADELADRGYRVIVGGLDRDFRGEPFGPMPQLLAIAEFVDKLTAICVKSGKPATRTQRIINENPAFYEDSIIMIGAKESYEPRSRKCHEVPRKK